MSETDTPDTVERLLQASGRRPAVPPERRARVRAAVYGEWQAGVASRVRPRWRHPALVLAASALAAALGLYLWQFPTGTENRQRAGVVETVSPASGLAAGDIVRSGAEMTTGAGERLALLLDGGHSLRLDVATRVRILGPAVIDLQSGAVYLDSSPFAGQARPMAPAVGPADGPGGRGIEIRTRLGSIRDIGTQFEVRLSDGSLAVAVREGRVVIAGREVDLDAVAGEAISLASDGRVERSTLLASDARWSWIESVTPPLDLSGHDLMDFLAWAARERGLRLEFADDTLAARASALELSGSVEGMSLDEALSSVLATCGLTHGVSDSRLLVQEATRPAP